MQADIIAPDVLSTGTKYSPAAERMKRSQHAFITSWSCRGGPRFTGREEQSASSYGERRNLTA